LDLPWRVAAGGLALALVASAPAPPPAIARRSWPNGAILRLDIADVRQGNQYVATIEDVAANDYRLRSLAGYSLTVAP
jgi:hypothetical protein